MENEFVSYVFSVLSSLLNERRSDKTVPAKKNKVPTESLFIVKLVLVIHAVLIIFFK
jgi:hypothetical protein